MNKLNIEVEHGELGLKNSHGDIVIIPKDKRADVNKMIKDECWGCIDSFVSTLPTMADYAADGSLIPIEIDPDPTDPPISLKPPSKPINPLTQSNPLTQPDAIPESLKSDFTGTRQFDDAYNKKDYNTLLQTKNDDSIKEIPYPSYKDQNTWLLDYIKSPKYKEILTNEFKKSGRNINEVDAEINTRYNNSKNKPVKETKIHPDGYGMVRGIYYNKQKNPNEQPLDPKYDYDLDNPSPEGWAKGNKGDVQIDPVSNLLDRSVYLHEETHRATDGNNRLTDFARKTLFDSSEKSEYPAYKDKKLNETYRYFDNPTEGHARLTVLKSLMSQYGIYDPKTENVTKEHIMKMMKNKHIKNNLDIQTLLQNILQGKGDLIELMNTIAYTGTNDNKNKA